jgi:hypothetical protein
VGAAGTPSRQTVAPLFAAVAAPLAGTHTPAATPLSLIAVAVQAAPGADASSVTR